METLHPAETVLKNKYGDCDDKVILGGAMLKTLGYDVALCLLKQPSANDFNHIYLQVKYNGQLIPFDTLIENGKVGMQAKGKKRIVFIY